MRTKYPTSHLTLTSYEYAATRRSSERGGASVAYGLSGTGTGLKAAGIRAYEETCRRNGGTYFRVKHG